MFGVISCGENDALDEDIKQPLVETLSIEVPESEEHNYEIPESEKIADLKTLEFKHPLQGVKLIDGKVPSGRMLMRMFNGSGMDSPWGFGRYGVCVDQGKEVSFELTNLPVDVDNLIGALVRSTT